MRSTSPITTARLPSRLSRRGAQLLHLQCWLWGLDIKREAGNLLLIAGLTRLRPPSGVIGCSQYSTTLRDGSALNLWGFGIRVHCAEDGCFLNRFEFVPRQTSRVDCWHARDFANAPRSHRLDAIAPALEWMAAYERGVTDLLGTEYRLRCANSGPSGDVPAYDLACAWESLAYDVRDWQKTASQRSTARL